MKDRSGLYVMVFIAMIASCSADNNTARIIKIANTCEVQK